MRVPASPLSVAAAVAAVALLGAAPGARAQPRMEPHLVSRAGEAMGTFVEMKVFTSDDAGARKAMGDAFAEIARLERLMTTWRDDSDISRVNAAAGKAPVVVSKEVLDCVARSLEYSRLSGGAFDITFYALHGLWKFDQDLEARVPPVAELKKRLALVDWRQVVVDRKRSTLFLRRPGMAVSLGGIGKGYAVDAATAVLRRAGFSDAIVQAGGDLMLSGSKGGAPWSAGIRDPRGPASDAFAVAHIRNHAFSTAGDYERSFLLGGRRYHHIIDPKTGFPATAARSVTIYAPDATTADGLDDAVFIMGPERGMALIESLPDVGAVMVDANNRVHVSKRLADVILVEHPPTPGL